MNDTTTVQSDTNHAFDSTVAIVSAFLSGANVPVQQEQINALITNTYQTLSSLLTPAQAAEPEQPRQEPAVSIRASVKKDHLVCLEDGKKVKMLKRYLMTNYGLTPDQYRAKWGLPADYPMVAPDYSERRRALAQEIGLGTKGRAARKTAAAEKAATPKKTKATKKAAEAPAAEPEVATAE